MSFTISLVFFKCNSFCYVTKHPKIQWLKTTVIYLHNPLVLYMAFQSQLSPHICLPDSWWALFLGVGWLLAGTMGTAEPCDSFHPTDRLSQTCPMRQHVSKRVSRHVQSLLRIESELACHLSSHILLPPQFVGQSKSQDQPNLKGYRNRFCLLMEHITN